MELTLAQMAEILNDLLESGHNPNARIRIAEQPTYPFEYECLGVVTRDEIIAHDQDVEEGEENPLRDHESEDDVVFVTGAQMGYGRKSTWHAVRRH